MAINYEQWCNQNTNVSPLVRALNSSMPEQYIGFYLENEFSDEIEYQKQFPWLGKCSLDIYIPSLCLAIEYDGVYYHSMRKANDDYKTSACRRHGIYLIRVTEHRAKQPKSRKHNVVSYYYEKNYRNIDVAVNDLFIKINKRYGTTLKPDVDLNRDHEGIISYIQNKYHSHSVACVWPEIKEYWDDEENMLTIFDVLRSNDGNVYRLKCPHCGRNFWLYMRYVQERKSLIPCECEYQSVEDDFTEAIRKYKETGEVVVLDNSLQSRRLYDRMATIATHIWRCESKEEAELYKKVGFDPKYIDVYLSLCENKDRKIDEEGETR